MSIHDVRNYLTILGNLPDYEPVFNQAKRLIEAQKALLKIVPPSVGSRCAVGKYADGVLLIYADNGMIASRLRHMAPAISQHLHKDNLVTKEIKIAVQPNFSSTHLSGPPKRKHQLNQPAIDHLNALIATLPTTSLLRQALVTFLDNTR
ncbi:MAG: DUF721 domain-containing protein [Nitrosomonas sp.]|nr:DUF721 domain-containing protein [Nitrosomonas sp.]